MKFLWKNEWSFCIVIRVLLLALVWVLEWMLWDFLCCWFCFYFCLCAFVYQRNRFLCLAVGFGFSYATVYAWYEKVSATEPYGNLFEEINNYFWFLLLLYGKTISVWLLFMTSYVWVWYYSEGELCLCAF